MPSYEFRCSRCGFEVEEEHRIGTARAMRQCPECNGKMGRLFRSFNIGAEALPNKRRVVIAQNAEEREMGRDRPAYQRMRRRGLQPDHIKGSARLEDRVDEPIDIQYRDLLDSGVPKSKIQEALAISNEVNAVENNGIRVGKR